MSIFTSKEWLDSEYLKGIQYASSNNLVARIYLHQHYTVTDKPDLQKDVLTRWFDQLPANAHILEAGCGRGDIWAKNIAHIPEGWTITLTDLSDGMLEDAKAHVGNALAKRIRWQVADVQDLPFSDNEFDLVIANFMLYHIPNLPQALRQIRRVLKPTAYLNAMTNSETHLQELFALAQQYRETVDTNPPDDQRAHFPFSLENGQAQLEAVFDNVTLESQPAHLWVTDLPPLLDYIASFIPNAIEAFSSEGGRVLTAQLEQEIAENGGIRIEKHSGTFIASGK